MSSFSRKIISQTPIENFIKWGKRSLFVSLAGGASSCWQILRFENSTVLPRRLTQWCKLSMHANQCRPKAPLCVDKVR